MRCLVSRGVHRLQAAQVLLVREGVRGHRTGQARALFGEELTGDRRRHCASDVGLDREQVAAGSFNDVAPHLRAGRGTHQCHPEPHPVAGALHTAGHEIRGAERAPQDRWVLTRGAASETLRLEPGLDVQPLHLAEADDEFLCEAVGEKRVCHLRVDSAGLADDRGIRL